MNVGDLRHTTIDAPHRTDTVTRTAGLRRRTTRPTMARGTPAPATGLSLQQLDLVDSQEEEDDSPLSPASIVLAGNELEEPTFLMGGAFEQQEPQQHQQPAGEHSQQQFPSMPMPQDGGVAIVRNIASFLSLSDAESIASLDLAVLKSDAAETAAARSSNWSVGDCNGMGEPLISWSSLGTTPPTPGLVMLSPTGDLLEEERYSDKACPELVRLEDDDDAESDDSSMKRRLTMQQKKWIQQKLTSYVFAHPGSIRSYCLEAHQAALNIQKHRQEQRHEKLQELTVDPETLREPSRRKKKEKQQRLRIIKMLIDSVLHNVPLSVMMDVVEVLGEVGLDTSFAVFHIQCASVNAVVSALSRIIHKIWETVINFNPFTILEATISLQFNAVGKTSEVLVSGIQSVATGVGSASTAALHRLSRSGAGVSASGSTSIRRTTSKSGLRRNRSSDFVMNQKLLRKLSTINSAAQVISYREREEEAVITKHAKKRVQRMMHYDVSLRPFVATVVVTPTNSSSASGSGPLRREREDSFGNVDFPTNANQGAPAAASNGLPPPPPGSASTSPTETPFMSTPKSFPATPSSRRKVMARGTRFVEDVVFLARDQLRVEDALGSENERTRAMATALREERRLAVFARDEGNGIALSCGQHMATKVGNVLYCSTRSMVPVLRNCFVYFEMSVMTPLLQASLATLSIGLSTLEMPLNTLVGAWKGSVGLCTTGQILTAGQWCSPLDPSLSAYGDNASVGCLVYLDDESAFETWDGVMVTAAVTFNVNGNVVSPPLFTTPMGGSGVMVPNVGDGFVPNAAAGSNAANNASRPLPQQMPGPVSTLPLLVPMEEELFPTLTLHSPATRVMCRFSAEDIIAASPESIGAPRGATVYAVDGSVLFDEDDLSGNSNHSELSSRGSFD